MNFERKLNATAPKSSNGSGVDPPKPFVSNKKWLQGSDLN